MPPDPTPAPVAPLALRVEPAAARDLPRIAELYLAQDEAARRLYHPLPFVRWRLRFLLRGLTFAQRWSRRWVRTFPRAAAGFLVGRLEPQGPVVAFGHLRFRWDSAGLLVAETGYFVEPTQRQKGLGTQFKRGLIAEARRFGARRVEALIDPSNIASVRLNQKLGFTFAPAPVPDRNSPHAQLIVAQLDLDPVPPPPDAAARAPVEQSQRARV